MAFGHRERHARSAQAFADRTNLGVGRLPRCHQLRPRRVSVAPIRLAAQDRLARRIGIDPIIVRVAFVVVELFVAVAVTDVAVTRVADGMVSLAVGRQDGPAAVAGRSIQEGCQIDAVEFMRCRSAQPAKPVDREQVG